MMKLPLALFVITLIISCNPETPVQRPNVIMIMTDDLGWGDTGFNGNTVIQTPNLDHLASKGIIFDRFYTASPVCSPTRASCITGRNPYRMNIITANSGHMKTAEVTLAEVLKGKGYRTGHFGKWHLGTFTTEIKDANRGKPKNYADFSIPSQHGFQEFFSTESKVPTFDPLLKPKVYDEKAGESPRYGWASLDENDSSEAFGTYYWEGKEMQSKENLRGENSKLIMDKALDFIGRGNESEDPFFAVIWLHTPHLPVVADGAHRNLYLNYDLKEQLYYGSISAMDEQIGRLWDMLLESGEADNTIIWFCSDNGPENGTPGSSGPFRERKRSLYEGGVRVPAFCVWEGMIDPNQKTSFPMVTSDYMPTILDQVSISHPLSRPMDGVSVRKAISGDQLERIKPIGFLFGAKMSWVSHQYKLISLDDGESFELYDLLSDPGETKDIAPENTELVAKMKKELFTWTTSVNNSRMGEDY